MDNELKQIDRYNTINTPCPMCQNYPLEYEITGGVKEVFCTHCDYYHVIGE